METVRSVKRKRGQALIRAIAIAKALDRDVYVFPSFPKGIVIDIIGPVIGKCWRITPQGRVIEEKNANGNAKL